MEAPGQLLKHNSVKINNYLLTFDQQAQTKNRQQQKQLPNSKAGFIQLSEFCDAKGSMYNLYDTLRLADIQLNANIILLLEFGRIASPESINQQHLITIADKTFRSASVLRILNIQENIFSLLI
ncbi:hypothetical protein pb186bvf_015063 [Paramecium bursaria]